MKDLTAKNLKDELWKTLNNIQDSSTSCHAADAIASQAREILRTTNVQLRIAQQAKRDVPTGVIDFSEK